MTINSAILFLDIFQLVILIMIVGVIILLIVGFHDLGIQDDKLNKLIRSVRMNETCKQLEDDLIFINKENQGLWVKQFDDNSIIKYQKEKNC